jgi:hypothetical protein
MHYKLCKETWKKKQLRRPGIGERAILMLINVQGTKMWDGFDWPKIGSSDTFF